MMNLIGKNIEFVDAPPFSEVPVKAQEGRKKRRVQGKSFLWFREKSNAAVAMLMVEMKQHIQITEKIFFHEMDAVSCEKTVGSRRAKMLAQFPFGRGMFKSALQATDRFCGEMPACA